MENNKEKLLILGVGNVLLGDEGIGVHSIKYLKDKLLPKNIELMDGGTGGFHMLSVMDQYKSIIMIDATLDNDAEGTLKVITPKFASDFPKALSSHDIGLRDLVETASLLGDLPKIYLITVSIKGLDDINMELSPNIKKTLPLIYEKIKEIFIQLK